MKSIAAGVLTLIIMQALGDSTAPDKVGGLLGWLATGLNHALSPDVAAIPRVATASKSSTSKPSTSPSTGGISLPRNPTVGRGPTVTV